MSKKGNRHLCQRHMIGSGHIPENKDKQKKVKGIKAPSQKGRPHNLPLNPVQSPKILTKSLEHPCNPRFLPCQLTRQPNL